MSLYHSQTIPIVLGSASPRRQQLFQWLFSDFIIRSSPQELQESTGDAKEFVLRNARFKADNLLSQVPNPGYLFSFDTVVALEDRILGKSSDADEAQNILLSLSGRTHEVHTAVVIHDGRGTEISAFVETSSVVFYDLTEQIVRNWLSTGRYTDKAGCYAIQDISALFIKSINGCYYNIMGLPVSALAQKISCLSEHFHTSCAC